jgi:hypothetical protein
MLLFGHDYIAYEPFYHISDIEAIAKTPSNSTLFLVFDVNNLDIITYLKENAIAFALEVTSLKEAIFAQNLGASYIITDENNATSIQKCAEHYLFDAKILCRAHNDEAIERLALEGIDGIIFAEAIIKI